MAFNVNLDLKWIVILAVVVISVMGISIFGVHSCANNENERLTTYNRQLSGNLTESEKNLEAAHTEMNVMKSELVTREELAKRLTKEKEEVDKNFEQFKKDNDLIIQSKDRTIASLRQQINGGSTDVVVSGDTCKDLANKCTISYSWSDINGRFKLIDPNIFDKNNETFTSSQIFKVYGEVYEQKNGSLATRRLVLREVIKDSNGNYIDIPDGKTEIVESSFQYVNPPKIEEEQHWYRIFRIRPVILGSVNVTPNLSETMLGAGIEFVNIWGFGANSHVSFDFKDIKHAGTFVGITYAPTFPKFKLNAGIGVSVGTSFYKPFEQTYVNIDLLFYLME